MKLSSSMVEMVLQRASAIVSNTIGKEPNAFYQTLIENEKACEDAFTLFGSLFASNPPFKHPMVAGVIVSAVCEACEEVFSGIEDAQKLVDLVGWDANRLTTAETAAMLRASLQTLGKGVRIPVGSVASFANKPLSVYRSEDGETLAVLFKDVETA